VPVKETVADAWRLLFDAPRHVMLPALAVHLPVSIAVAVATMLLFFTVFRDEEFLVVGDILSGEFASETSRGVLFAVIAIAAVQFLFGQVARAATIVSVAGAAKGSPRRLPEALDPAFVRMGAVLWQSLLWLTLMLGLVFSVVGLALLPYVWARLSVGTEVMMLENRRPLAALAGSWALTAGKALRAMGVLLLTVLICAGPLLAGSMLGLLVTGSRTQQVLMFGLAGLVQTVLFTPVTALLTSAMTLFYLKAREVDNGRSPARVRFARPDPPGQGP
jgi:hypothetical protein